MRPLPCDSAIRELSARRFQAKQLEDQLFATEAYCSQVTAFLLTYKTLVAQELPETAVKAVMDSLLKDVVVNLDKVRGGGLAASFCT